MELLTLLHINLAADAAQGAFETIDEFVAALTGAGIIDLNNASDFYTALQNSATLRNAFQNGLDLINETNPDLNWELPDLEDEDDEPSDIFTDESVFEMLSAIMTGEQGLPEGTPPEVLETLRVRLTEQLTMKNFVS